MSCVLLPSRLLLISATLCAEVRNLDRSGGIIPINLGLAKLEESEHILIHDYELTGLYNEVDNLNSQFSAFLGKIQTSRKLHEKFDEYCTLYTHVRDLVQMKISNIRRHSATRHRRGLINGLGTVLKAITGNLDNNDKEAYDKILNGLDKRYSKQYSIVNQLIAHYNNTLQTIRSNNDQIRTKFAEIKSIINPFDGQIALYADFVYHLHTSMTLILNTMSEIETSITFCKLGVLHPSIISTHVLEEELSKLSLNLTDTLTYESLIKVQCHIRSNKIVYFLTLPVYQNVIYHLYYLYPTPWYVDGSYTTIVPKFKYLLKGRSKDSIIPLTDRCLLNEMFYCDIKLLSQAAARCERNILSNGSPSICQFTKLDINTNYVSRIPETNQLLAVFPREDQLTIQSGERSETLTLHGIHLINPTSDSVYYHDTLISTQLNSIGSPTLLSFTPPNIDTLNLTRMSIPFEDINFKTLDNLHLNLSPFDSDSSGWYPAILPSMWTVLLYVLLGSLFGYALFNYLRRNPPASVPTSP